MIPPKAAQINATKNPAAHITSIFSSLASGSRKPGKNSSLVVSTIYEDK